MKKKLFLSLFFLFILVGFYFSQGIYLSKSTRNAKGKIFLIKKGEGVKKISLDLEKQGLIKSGFLFQVYVFLSGKGKNLQAGEYKLSESMDIPTIVNIFSSGKTIKKRITIIEGWDIKKIGDYLQEKRIIPSAEKFTEYCQEHKLEGYLFPDTYEVGPGESLKEITERMIDNFNKKLTLKLRRRIEEEKKTIPEIMTMASLIEKEAKTMKDKKIISGILWKRLKYHMPLQVDATINYINKREGKEVYLKDLKIDSPYNTYQHIGLPPAPICNPGMESIIAAIYPEKSDYWYYLSGSDGKIYFSKTLAEHNLKRIKYLKN